MMESRQRVAADFDVRAAPQAGQLFRDCAAEFGVQLGDPSAALGSESLAAAALRQGGFADIAVVAGRARLEALHLRFDAPSATWRS